jgi:hypothetical protein
MAIRQDLPGFVKPSSQPYKDHPDEFPRRLISQGMLSAICYGKNVSVFAMLFP